jgi:ATP-dependent DNA ligase
MALPLPMPFGPMEALSVDAIPVGEEWQYEPKWDGFRALAFRDGDKIEIQSKSGRLMTRYFPELVAALGALKARKFVLDGELVVPAGRAFSFDALLQRIHPAASRVRRLAAETPVLLIIFDLLVGADGRALTGKPLVERRRELESFYKKYCRGSPRLRLSPATTRLADAERWLKRVGATLDGVVAKRRDLPYRSGDRSGMQKIKNYRSTDCVVGGFRYNEGSALVGSLLLGLYDEDGLLHHVGFTSTIKREDKPALTKKLKVLIAPLDSPATRRAVRAAGRPSAPASGSRSSRSSWSRSATTISRAAASVTARASYAGGLTRRRGNARSIRSSRRRLTRWRC